MNHTRPKRRRAATAAAVAAARSSRSVAAGKHAGSYSSIWRNDSTALCSMQSQLVWGSQRAMRWASEVRRKSCLHVLPAIKGGEACDMEKASLGRVCVVGDSNLQSISQQLIVAVINCLDYLLGVFCRYLLSLYIFHFVSLSTGVRATGSVVAAARI